MNKRRLLVLIALGGLTLYIGTRQPIERCLAIVSSVCSTPFLKAATLITQTFIEPFINFKNAQQLKQELLALQDERDSFLQELIAARASTWYLERTADLVTFYDRYQYNPSLCGQIILKILNSKTQYGLIDRGAHDGVKNGMIAVFKNMLVGKVVEVYPFLSKILFITDPTCTIAVSGVISKANGIHRGIAECEETSLGYVSALTPLCQDELIISNGTGTLFPAGFGVGAVKTVEADELYQRAAIKPLIKVKNIDYCYLLERSAEPILAANKELYEDFLRN